MSRRRDNLTWGHHYEIASLKKLKEVKGKLTLSDDPDMDKIQELLSMAEKENLSVRDLREVGGTVERDRAQIRGFHRRNSRSSTN